MHDARDAHSGTGAPAQDGGADGTTTISIRRRSSTPDHHHPHVRDRLETLQRVQDAGLSVCCGGIVGMGESSRDRCALLAQIGRLDPHPESLPVNLLVRIAGTPLGDAAELDPIELVRTVAAARIVAPTARVRLSAGRRALTGETQALCFMAGANSIFSGEKLLTSPNPTIDEDQELMGRLGLRFQS